MITAALTALFAVVVFVVGQFVQRFLLEPIQEQRKLIGEIAYCLVFYANAYDMSASKDLGLVAIHDPTAVAKHLRELAGKLTASVWSIPWYALLTKGKAVLPRDDILMAAHNLVGWSNSIHHGDPTGFRTIIAQRLKIPSPG